MWWPWWRWSRLGRNFCFLSRIIKMKIEILRNIQCFVISNETNVVNWITVASKEELKNKYHPEYPGHFIVERTEKNSNIELGSVWQKK
jgi:hypothetical protein